jgi:hypothetical protein
MTPISATAHRTMVANFDSVEQQLLFEQVGFREAWLRLCAQLRTADLLSDELIVTDAQLLDGIFFLLLGPDGFAEMLGRSRSELLPVVIVTRSPDLSSALTRMTSAPGFIWSSDAALTQLEARGAVAVAPGRLDAARADWLRAERQNRVRVSTYEGLPFPIEAVFEEAAGPPDGLPDGLAEQLRGTTNRSTARQLVRGSALVDGSGEPALTWWENIYAEALARQHGATWLAFGPGNERGVSAPPLHRTGGAARIGAAWLRVREARPLRRRKSWHRSRSNARALPLDGSMISTMAAITPPVYALVAHRAQLCSAEWARNQDPQSLRSVALVVRQTTEVAGTWKGYMLTTIGRGSALGAAFLLVIATVFHPGMNDWVAVPVITALLSQVPWADMSAIVISRPGKLQGVIHVRGEQL